MLTFLLLVLVAPGARASSVTLVVGSAEKASGSKVEVPIDVRDAQQLGALQMDLTYDPAILDAPSVEKGALPQEITLGSNVVSPGRLRLVMNTSAKDSVSGNGTLMKVVFLVKGQSGQECDLRLEQVQAWDNTAPEAPPYEMLVDVEPGKFSVGGPGLPLPLLAGIGLVLVSLFALAKRKHHAAGPRPAAAAPAPGATTCGGCGAALAPGVRFCGNCGQPLP